MAPIVGRAEVRLVKPNNGRRSGDGNLYHLDLEGVSCPQVAALLEAPYRPVWAFFDPVAYGNQEEPFKTKQGATIRVRDFCPLCLAGLYAKVEGVEGD